MTKTEAVLGALIGLVLSAGASLAMSFRSEEQGESTGSQHADVRVSEFRIGELERPATSRGRSLQSSSDTTETLRASRWARFRGVAQGLRASAPSSAWDLESEDLVADLGEQMQGMGVSSVEGVRCSGRRCVARLTWSEPHIGRERAGDVVPATQAALNCPVQAMFDPEDIESEHLDIVLDCTDVDEETVSLLRRPN